MRTIRFVVRGIGLVFITLFLFVAALLLMLAYPFRAVFRDND